MTRKDALAYMRIAGYHNDKPAFTRLLIEHRISRESANEAWRKGLDAKTVGMKCNCYRCSKEN